jgi:very-short-patch-repair endonuclease
LPGVVALADPRAESPGETRLRVLLRRAGLPTPEVQYRVLDEHGFVLGRVDLAYPAAKLAIEYDGASHLAALRVLRDRRRDRELADLGWETMRLGRDDLDTGPQTVQRVERALARRTRAAEGRSASPSATPVRHPDGRRRTVVAFAVFRPARAAWIRRLSGGLSSPAAAQDRWV